MTFALEDTVATLASVTNRVEKHGAEDVPAISLRLKITAANTILDKLSATMRSTLYTKPDGQNELPGIEECTPLLRTLGIDHLVFTSTLNGWNLMIDHGIDGISVCGACKVDEFKVAPKQGGTVELSFRVGTSDVEPEGAGLLWAKNGQEVIITLTPPDKPLNTDVDNDDEDRDET